MTSLGRFVILSPLQLLAHRRGVGVLEEREGVLPEAGQERVQQRTRVLAGLQRVQLLARGWLVLAGGVVVAVACDRGRICGPYPVPACLTGGEGGER